MTRANTNHWRKATLGEVADVNRGNTSILKSAYTEVGYPAFSGAGNDGKLPDAAYDRTGVVISAVGAYCGKTWLAKGKWSCINNTLRFFATDPEVDTEYLYWRTRNPDVWPKRGSAQPFIAMSDARAISILLPPLSEQRAIAGMLGALDGKMQHNRRTAQGTERLARAIFRAWFVDFAPVKAKIDGATSFPSMPQPVFDALPTRLVESKIGPVPEGWNVVPLDEAANFLNGLALQKFPPFNDGADLPVIKIAQLRRGSTEGAAYANDSIDGKYKIKDGDLLFSWSGTLEAEFWFGGAGSLNQHLFKVTSANYPLWLAYEWIHQHMPEFRLIASSKATTMGHIKREHLHNARVVVPTSTVLQEADRRIGRLHKIYAQAMMESRKLAEMRDYLLPKLLSGEVRVKDTHG